MSVAPWYCLCGQGIIVYVPDADGTITCPACKNVASVRPTE